MSKASQPLSEHQQELINIVKAAHATLLVARQTKAAEIQRRIAVARIEFERQLEEAEARIRHEVESEVALHASNQDEAVLTAYEAGVPVRRIALDGFGNQYDGAVHQILRELRADGRVGNRVGYQRNAKDELDVETEVVFPEPVDVDSLLAEATTISEPVFTEREPLQLVEPSVPGGDDGISVPAVTLTMDPRDPYFKQIEQNARKGTPYLHATTATLYLHPATGKLTVYESKETGDLLWDHPVARWVKDHPEEAESGYRDATGSID